MKRNKTAAKQSSEFYDDNHLLEKQLGKITTLARDKRPALNLKKEKMEGVSKTMCSMKE